MGVKQEGLGPGSCCLLPKPWEPVWLFPGAISTWVPTKNKVETTKEGFLQEAVWCNQACTSPLPRGLGELVAQGRSLWPLEQAEP